MPEVTAGDGVISAAGTSSCRFKLSRVDSGLPPGCGARKRGSKGESEREREREREREGGREDDTRQVYYRRRKSSGRESAAAVDFYADQEYPLAEHRGNGGEEVLR